MINRLTDALEFQSQALVLRSERQRMLASNIANADTPGYQARELRFADALRAVTHEGGPVHDAQGAVGPSQTNSRHLLVDDPNGVPASARVTAMQSQTSLDSNGVDMDRERASFVDNATKYEATLRFINGTVRTTLDSMRSHNAAV
jgi:flagellar basal-body rod protein FlgB